METTPPTATTDWVVFHNRTDLNQWLVEAAAARWAYTQDVNVQWLGGNNRKVDITWPQGAIDAKTAFVHEVTLPHVGHCRALGFMNTSRHDAVRDGVTAYALGVPDGAANVEIAADGRVCPVGSVQVTVYVVPAEVIDIFERALKLDGNPRQGFNRYLPLADAEHYRVLGPALS